LKEEAEFEKRFGKCDADQKLFYEKHVLEPERAAAKANEGRAERVKKTHEEIKKTIDARVRDLCKSEKLHIYSPADKKRLHPVNERIPCPKCGTPLSGSRDIFVTFAERGGIADPFTLIGAYNHEFRCWSCKDPQWIMVMVVPG
jgi:hypothetical protein